MKDQGLPILPIQLVWNGLVYDMLKIFQNLLNQVRDYKINESLCTRIISPKDSCDKCVKACPLSCISITKTITIGSDCIGCGICSSKCPTKAITMELMMPEYLHHKIQEGSFQSLSCRNSKKSNDYWFKSFCLGSLSDEYILYLLLKKPSAIKDFDSSKCKNCELSSGFLDFEQRKNKLSEKLEQLNLKGADPSDSVVALSNVSEYDEEKRSFLKSIFQLPKEDESTGSEGEVNERVFYQVYKELLESEPKLYGVIDADFPQKNGECCQCEACIKLCPNKALRLEDSSLVLDVTQCCGCGLCEKVCYEKALTMGKISYDDFDSDSLKII